MNTAFKYIEEFPNLDYVLELGGTDFDFERKFIAIMKKEFIEQLGKYLYHMKKDEPRAAALMVHKIKFNFSVLSMKNAFELSEVHEERLRVGNTELDDDFKKCLRKVNEFLKTFKDD